ncbi:MAG: hypothetical protein LUQ35_01285 [Methanoregula sp.]|jgi:hypothetical protein|nr:hypothetical protein [Methanoregula sp.]
MERFLDAYIERMRPYFPGFPPETAHEIASAFLAFKFGLYANAVRECTNAIALVPDGESNGALKKALEIIRANAQDRENSLVTTDLGIAFGGQELRFVAVNLPAETIEAPNALNLDNALILVYVVALITSPDDDEALEEHRTLIVRMLRDYKKALGLE